MNQQAQRPISELLADDALINEAICRAVRAAVLQTAREGRPVSSWENGKVVWIPPEEILARFSNGPADSK